MRQRGRKPSVTVVALNATGEAPRLTPPAFLTACERLVFSEIVNNCTVQHFVKSDIPLLASFARATVLAQTAKGLEWERAVKIQAMLATRLRLAPQARLDPKTLGRQQLPVGRMPWMPDAG